MSDFRKAMFWTAIPVVALSLAIVAVTAVFPGESFLGLILFWWLGGFWLFLAAMAAIGLGIAGKKQKMAGVLAGLGIGIVALGGSCFAAVLWSL